MFGRYHLTDTGSTFFNRTDIWTVPAGDDDEQRLPTEAYYVSCGCPASRQPSSCCSSR